MPKCLSALSAQKPKYLSDLSAPVPEYIKYPSAQVPSKLPITLRQPSECSKAGIDIKNKQKTFH